MAILVHVATGLGVLVLTYGLWMLRQIGGGDAKMAAATALWIGWENLLQYGLLASMLGGALAVALLAIRKWPVLPASFLRAPWVARLHDQKTGIPYGIALAIAGVLVFPSTPMWVNAIGVL
jgi:prepilin peptidase CpaA